MWAKVTTSKQRVQGVPSQDPCMNSPVRFLREVCSAWEMAQWTKSVLKARGTGFRPPEHIQVPGRHGGLWPGVIPTLEMQSQGIPRGSWLATLSGVSWQAPGSVRNSTAINKVKSRKEPGFDFAPPHPWGYAARIHTPTYASTHTNACTDMPHTCKIKKGVQ